MRIVLVTDAWHPQVNGVVRTWTTMQQILTEWGHELIVVNPQGSRTVPAPSEPDLRLCLQPGRQLRRILGDTAAPTARDTAAMVLGLVEAGLDVIKTEGLYRFDGERGYSVAQGE
ncbi:MAG: hypothetical protein KBO59_05990, partial [Achromobacter sp.]|nr:hypothetical protein [Achromobacter sp.]